MKQLPLPAIVRRELYDVRNYLCGVLSHVSMSFRISSFRQPTYCKLLQIV